MIEIDEVIRFFDERAKNWDANQDRSELVISIILARAGIKPGIDVLDVACGTGILFGDYLARSVGSVTAVDISPEMAKIAAMKYPDAQIDVICADIETVKLDKTFDAVVVYNSFPHFAAPKRLIKTLAGYTKPGGRLTVAHGASREAIDAAHLGAAARVSNGLMHEDELAELMRPWFKVDVTISDELMYEVSGVRRSDAESLEREF